jgi:AcrR family transcriptional regulator
LTFLKEVTNIPYSMYQDTEKTMTDDSILSTQRERRPDTRPTEIMDAALKIFSSKGFRVTTLDQVAKAAGVTKGAIYHYFQGKEDLLLKALRHWVEDRIVPWQERDAQLPGSGPASARLRLAIRYMWESWQDPAMVGVFHLIEGELVPRYPRVIERWHRESVRPAVQNLVDIIEDGKAKGELRQDLDTEVIVPFLMSGLTKVAVHQHIDPGHPLRDFPADRIIDSILDVFFRGIRA